MNRLDELNALVARLQAEFNEHQVVYIAAVRAGDSKAAAAALERQRPINDQLQPALVERLNLLRQV